MARILVIFGTTEGQTAKVADAMGQRLRIDGYSVEIVDAAKAQPDPASFDAVVVAASVHAGRYQRRLVRWVSTHSTALNGMPTAFVSVCLGVLEHNPATDRELQAILDRFLRATAWRPGEVKIVAGALKYSQYNFLKRWLMKRIVRKAGGDVDTSRDYEYTDWNGVSQFVDRFVAGLQQSTVSSHFVTDDRRLPRPH
jgi:menaquinone-dependent protoporphyrinogen oxidase